MKDRNVGGCKDDDLETYLNGENKFALDTVRRKAHSCWKARNRCFKTVLVRVKELRSGGQIDYLYTQLSATEVMWEPKNFALVSMTLLAE